MKRVLKNIWRGMLGPAILGCRLVDVGAALEQHALIPIGLHKQLLVDDYAIAEKNNVTRELGKVTKQNDGRPVLVPDKPWEDDLFGCYNGTVLHDGKRFRMWYPPFRFAMAYAKSTDGLHWEKPALGLYDFSIDRAKREPGEGGFWPREAAPLDFRGKVNNIIGHFGDGATCYLDPHETDPDHRYKLCYGHATKIGACLAHSSDGIHWTDYNRGEPVTGRASDTYNQIVWDEDAKLYRMYTRTDYSSGDIEIRGNRGMVNADIKADPTAWKTIRSWKFDRKGPEEHKRRQIYGLTDWIHEGIHFALMLVYEWPGNPPRRWTGSDHFKRHERDVTNFYIATSRDGDAWDLRWVYAEEPLVPRGPDGSFDKDAVIPNSNIVTWRDKHWIYYTGSRERHWQFPHKPAIGLATLPSDRFVCLAAGSKMGTVTTRPFRPAKTRLELNADARDGQIVVEVLDGNGRPIPGFTRAECQPLRNVDALRLIPSWSSGSTLASLRGKTIRLKFYLVNTKLYAFDMQRPLSVDGH